MKLETLRDAFIHELKDLHGAEKQLVKALPKMAKAASDDELSAGFEEHLEQTEEHVRRIESILTRMGESLRGGKCEAMEGLIKEGSRVAREDGSPEVIDALLITAAQRVEHYEIAGYGCARTFAEQLGDAEAAQLLQQTLNEESETDQKLSQIARRVNVMANGV